ncbi:MAG: 4,5-DOPA dioxygenase extradiol [Candidatus Kapabacteria bacterium]|nr:4,5-DOPA dioxygenase extradiol [Candidatus Kapabacteria bacterium]
MKRRHFLLGFSSIPFLTPVMNSLSELHALPASDTMPVLFVGHGSPMNGIEDNEFSRRWKKLGEEVPVPKAVLCISAHWLTKGTHITAMEKPKTIHDFGGFPEELFKVQYNAPGSPSLAKETSELVKKTNVGLDHDWGLDHGTWSITKQMFPKADIPVLQLSIDYARPPQYHYDLGKELAALRNKGVLILGSGNMVHNLRMVAWDKLDAPEYGFDWAHEINASFKKYITERNHTALINYQQLGNAAKLAIPTPDHYYPLLYTLGLQNKNEQTTFFNDKAVGGSLTMTSVRIG